MRILLQIFVFHWALVSGTAFLDALVFAESPVIFETTFSDAGLNDWEIFGSDWIANDNVLSCNGKSGPRALRKDLNLKDFELELDVKLEKQGSQAGVVFHSSDHREGVDAYRGYFAGLDSTSNQVVWGVSDIGWQPIASQPAPIKIGEWYRLRLRAIRGNITVYVNELPVALGCYPKIDGIDSRFTKGRLGLRVLGGKASFRGLVVRNAKPHTPVVSYTNPVQAGCADPVVLKYQGQYYAYCTHTPDYPNMPQGIRLHISTDLVHWADQGFVLKNEDSWGDSRFWAPDIIEKDGTFYLYYAADTRICVATASTPLGPFKQTKQEPMSPATIRIDGHVFKDTDGQCYFYYVHFNKGNEIWGGKLNSDMFTVDERTLQKMIIPDQAWEQHKGRVVEGPLVIHREGTYYLTYSGSHFESPEYAVGYATSSSPMGPWKKYEQNPIMKSTSYAHGTAHHGLTTSPDDKEMFIVYHRHHSLTETEPRQMAIDRIQFVPQANGPAILEVWGPTTSPQRMPSGAP